jgi:hypothetical protein
MKQATRNRTNLIDQRNIKPGRKNIKPNSLKKKRNLHNPQTVKYKDKKWKTPKKKE